jgi:molybdopterin-guanine dinucleotide biosynthesis protein A
VTREESCAAFVLAGGGSTRFGRDKALAEIVGKPMLVRMRELIVGPVTRDVCVIGSAAKYGGFGAKCVEDHWPGEGPLGGIVTALLDAGSGAGARVWSLIVGCDMPFLTAEWLRFLAQRAAASDADVVLPRSQHGLEPLCACYKTSAGKTLQSQFEFGVRKITQALSAVKVEVLDETEWKRFDSAGRLFWNMNTPADYDEARRILEAERG